MNLLLDTHIALWAIADSPKLPAKARELIANQRNTVWISAASLWEITIKHSLGRGDMPVSGSEALAYFEQAGYRLLPIEPEHVVAVGELPHHHADPFDRLLVAQARQVPMHLITHDALVAHYGETVMRV
ncbi:MAG: type II toxin-antitoxin system VapC family toxin [Gammaproteobacteria bacterium]|nr:type II toxin-antitoxin system VapC family toxin [Gammaproteobacteria bacterium]